MAVEIDMLGKDPMVYGDVFSSGDPVESEPTIDSSILLSPEPDFFSLSSIPAQPPIETIEK